MADEFDGRLGCSRHLGPVRLLGLNMMLRTGCETCWIGGSFRAECPKASNAIRIQLVESPQRSRTRQRTGAQRTEAAVRA